MDIKKIKDLLKDCKLQEVENYSAYLQSLYDKYDKEQKTYPNRFWLDKITPERFAFFFKKIANEGLVFDGKHITLSTRGISLDYVAYKNKMLLVYPESQISFGIVYDGDEFSFQEINGKVLYTHKHNNPFKKSDDKIIGCYCVIRNNRGEILKTLDKKEIEKHRAVAQTDSMWKKWFSDMVIKTVVKKACKVYFDDVVEGIDDIDNESIDLDLPTNGNLDIKARVEACTTIEAVKALAKELNPNANDIEYFVKRENEIRDSEYVNS
jgi:hypothetical protein